MTEWSYDVTENLEHGRGQSLKNPGSSMDS